MADPSRPTAHGPIESVWGQAVHDQVFTPKGCRVHGTSSTNVNVTPINTVPIDVADSDPGSWMNAAADKITCPAGADGLYSYAWRLASTNGTTGDTVRGIVYVNGAQVTSAIEQCITGVQITISGAGHLTLTAGDIITMGVQRTGGATLPIATLTALSVIRHGSDYGA